MTDMDLMEFCAMKAKEIAANKPGNKTILKDTTNSDFNPYYLNKTVVLLFANSVRI